MALDDLPADRQATTSPRILTAGVQPLKHLKKACGLARLNANPVIADSKAPVSAVPLGRHMNAGRFFAVKLQRIANEVLEHLA